MISAAIPAALREQLVAALAELLLEDLERFPDVVDCDRDDDASEAAR